MASNGLSDLGVESLLVMFTKKMFENRKSDSDFDKLRPSII